MTLHITPIGKRTSSLPESYAQTGLSYVFSWTSVLLDDQRRADAMNWFASCMDTRTWRPNRWERSSPASIQRRIVRAQTPSWSATSVTVRKAGNCAGCLGIGSTRFGRRLGANENQEAVTIRGGPLKPRRFEQHLAVRRRCWRQNYCRANGTRVAAENLDTRLDLSRSSSIEPPRNGCGGAVSANVPAGSKPW
jgi:hypothetical protein